MSFILGVRAALFALVHGVTLSLQLRKIYHLVSTRFALFYHGLLLFLSPTNSKKIFY